MEPSMPFAQPAATYQLVIKTLFNRLTQREKLYAHFLARAAWHGSRIILRQTSPEGPGILDFITKLYEVCDGRWIELAKQSGVGVDELNNFLEFSGHFLSNLGNYFGDGDRKVVPKISEDSIRKLASSSPEATAALEQIIGSLLSVPPHKLGFTDSDNQSNYYPGKERITKDEISAITKIMESSSVEPENTRIQKTRDGTRSIYHILLASAEKTEAAIQLHSSGIDSCTFVEHGDHAAELSRTCEALASAIKYAANEAQVTTLSKYIECFRTGNSEAYRKSQEAWVTDISPRVESIMGFVEPYRDPYGVRAEWEGVSCISDPDETAKLKALVDNSTKFIRMLPWAVPGVNDGKGPFEANLFQPPDFTIVHALAFCTSEVWEAVNLPNYSYIRETFGSKNIVFANRMSANNNPNRPCFYVHPSEVKQFRDCNHIIRFIVTSIHELLGHGTGKLLTETAPGVYNFDQKNPPINPLTGKPIETWYKLGQTWTGVFEKLATSVEECRAMLVSYYLAENKEVLALFGYTDASLVTADSLVYNTFLHIGVEGILALHSFNIQDGTWGAPHARANFTILKHLLLDGNGVIKIEHDTVAKTVHVRIDNSKIASEGKESLARMLCRLHVWRCIADVESCNEFYESLSVVGGEFEVWKRIVDTNPEPGWKFVQPNTFLREDGDVELIVYEESNEGIIKSFVDRKI